jgi:hypothetical protein
MKNNKKNKKNNKKNKKNNKKINKYQKNKIHNFWIRNKIKVMMMDK